jgi:hypothetical protein
MSAPPAFVLAVIVATIGAEVVVDRVVIVKALVSRACRQAVGTTASTASSNETTTCASLAVKPEGALISMRTSGWNPAPD